MNKQKVLDFLNGKLHQLEAKLEQDRKAAAALPAKNIH